MCLFLQAPDVLAERVDEAGHGGDLRAHPLQLPAGPLLVFLELGRERCRIRPGDGRLMVVRGLHGSRGRERVRGARVRHAGPVFRALPTLRGLVLLRETVGRRHSGSVRAAVGKKRRTLRHMWME